MGRPDKAARAAIARRRSEAIDLRLAGVDWLTIARKLAADPIANSDGIAYPQGYGIERYRKSIDPPTDEALSFFDLATDRVMGREAQRARPPGC
ncbi:hypothetical protein [Streptomyces sp. WP-1]|uniref:hypothetical protein n=1 Tax=Streptomyces sp. WP-1 TaxID=3041497 RepID=UPI0026488BC1|nr:hypothetical protein [Streptomyces sp. WP-1]WKE68157.1 hypothetical protein QHG49_03545 [Streptomyces sp. WP-1]